ncbi:MAG TPA: DUF6748 domain-containing protein [Polyangiaceae bacterium]|nr:DUF6748 domain-containing protein [Polyangiaceae bacterium]
MLKGVAVRWAALGPLLLIGCGGDAEPGGRASEPRSQHLEASAAAATYLRVRRDDRRCPSPRCGGFFVQRVNFPATLCADGRSAVECYVAGLDLAALTASATERAALLGLPESRLVRGYLGPVLPGSLDFGLLRVTEAWQGHEGQTPHGTFLRVREHSAPCQDAQQNAACSSFSAAPLNREVPAFSARALVLPATTGPNRSALRQLASAEGLLLAAPLMPDEAGEVALLEASEYYLPLAVPPLADAGILVDAGLGVDPGAPLEPDEQVDAGAPVDAAVELRASPPVDEPVGECGSADPAECFTLNGSL